MKFNASSLLRKFARINNFPNYATAERSLSYIQRIRFFQSLKEVESEFSKHLSSGKFLVYCKSKPLLRQNKITTTQELVWLTYKEVQELCPDSLNTSVILDVCEEGTPNYSIQVGYLPVEAAENIEKHTQGKFLDLRVALFLVKWREAHTLSRANSLFMWSRNTAFCGKCGSATERNNSGYSRKCSGCSMMHYPSSNPVGIVMITDPSHEHALLVRQPRHPPGMYSCVAGFSDVGETLEETVRREVAEEVGLEVQEVQYAASQHWPFPSSLMVGCFAVAEKKELSIDVKELEDAKWFTRTEISEAIERTKDNPWLRKFGSSTGELFIAPPGAIANNLITNWIKGTEVHKINQHIC